MNQQLNKVSSDQKPPLGGWGFVIPAIDIIDGKCVRLEQGNYDKVTLYHKEPLEVAKKFEDAGLKRLHLVETKKNL